MEGAKEVPSGTQLAQLAVGSPVGPLFLVASDAGLHGVHWKAQKLPNWSARKQGAALGNFLKDCEKQIHEYLEMKRRAFDLPLVFRGTLFQMKVWGQLQKIPYGQTWSYSRLAEAIGNKKAVRAVGSANGKNPLALFIPCHRVIAADGSLGGYAGGVGVKKKLLEMEKGRAF